MVALAWSDEKRLEYRRAWLHKERSVNFDELAHKVLGYLNRQAFLGRLAYPAFKREGFEVIGSGQIEGANIECAGGSIAYVWCDLERGWCGCEGVCSGLVAFSSSGDGV